MRSEWQTMVAREGLAPPAPVGGEEPTCPACGAAGPLVDGACPDCGLALG